MIKKTILINTIALGLLSGGFSKQAFAEDLNVINENSSESVSNMIVEGDLSETIEIPEIPEDDWMKITLPTSVVFNSSKNQTKIESSDKYEIINDSNFPVKVHIKDYNITGGGSVNALSILEINRTRGTGQYNQKICLVDEYNSGATIDTYQINREFVKLADKDGKLENGLEGDSSTNFYFTGEMDKRNVNEKNPTINSNINFKFTAVK